MRVLGLDPSTDTGFAVVDSGRKIVASGSLHFPKLKGWERVQAMSFAALELVHEHKPDHVVLEEIIVGRASSAIVVIQLASFIRYLLWQEKIAYTDVHPSTLKKFLTGNGNANKEQIMVHVTAKYGIMPKNNNEADAINCAVFGLAVRDYSEAPDTAAKALVKSWILKNPTPVPLLA